MHIQPQPLLNVLNGRKLTQARKIVQFAFGESDMTLKQTKPGIFALHNSGGFKLEITLARAYFSHMARQLTIQE